MKLQSLDQLIPRINKLFYNCPNFTSNYRIQALDNESSLWCDVSSPNDVTTERKLKIVLEETDDLSR